MRYATKHHCLIIDTLTLKVVCFCCLLKRFRSLLIKQCRSRSDCFCRGSLIWVHTVCRYTYIWQCKKYVQHSDAFFAGALRVKTSLHVCRFWQISKWLPLRRFWIFKWNDFSDSLSPCYLWYLQALVLSVIWALTRINLSSGVCELQRRGPACASVQSDQHLCYSLFRKYHI